MKKFLKFSFVIILICSFLLTQNALGAFGVVEGERIKYKLNTSVNDITFDNLQEQYVGFNATNTIVDAGTITKVVVDSVAPMELGWNSTVGPTSLTGTCPGTSSYFTYWDFLIRAYFYPDHNHANLWQIHNTGVFSPFYYEPYELPLFISIAPANWDQLRQFESNQEFFLNDYFHISRITDFGATLTEENSIFELEWWFSYFYDDTMMMFEMTKFNTSTTISYDMVTGVLLSIDSSIDLIGEYYSKDYSITSEYSIEKTDISDFMEFLAENKWYFIGGGSGLVVLVAAGTTIGLVARKKGKGKSKKKK